MGEQREESATEEESQKQREKETCERHVSVLRIPSTIVRRPRVRRERRSVVFSSPISDTFSSPTRDYRCRPYGRKTVHASVSKKKSKKRKGEKKENKSHPRKRIYTSFSWILLNLCGIDLCIWCIHCDIRIGELCGL